MQTVWVFFLEKKRKRNIVWEFTKIFETMVGVEPLEAINAQCVARVGTVFFGKIPWSTSPRIFYLWSVTQGFHTTIAIRVFGLIARKGACTVIRPYFARSVDIIAWPVHRRFAFCTSWKVSEVIQRSGRNKK